MPFGHTLDEYLAAGLGKLPDPEVARRLGVSRQAVYAFREKHEIKRIPAPNRKTGPRRDTIVLGEQIRPLALEGLIATEIAERLGVPAHQVRVASKVLKINVPVRRRTTDWWLDQPWHLSNQEIGKLCGRTAHEVARMRYLLKSRGHALPRSPNPRAR